MSDLELEDVFVHGELKDGRMRFSTYLTNLYDPEEDAELMEAMAHWNSLENVGVAQNFWLSAALDTMIDGHQWYGNGPNITADAKPKFDALRAELVEMIARIDALHFTTTGTA